MVSLRNILSIVKSTAVSYKWLKERIPKNVSIFRYKELRGKTRHTIFNGKIGIVVLIPKSDSKVGHFIVLLARPNHIEYFSSLGNSMEAEAKQLGVSPNTFRFLLGQNYIYNRNKLQKNKYTVQDCAVFCLLRLKFHKMKIREFNQLFSRKIILDSSDDIASLMGLVLIL